MNHSRNLVAWLRALTYLAPVLGAIVAAGACDDFRTYEQGLYAPDGADCAVDSRCESGLCLEGTCTPSCVTNSDCEGEQRCKVPPTREYGHCVDPCTTDPGDGVLCVNGIPTECALLGEEYCETCGCPGNQYCLPAPVNRCIPQARVGEACAHDGQCRTGNCSAFAGVCRVSVGAECTADNCDRCLSTEDSSYCTRDCGEDAVRWGETALEGEACNGAGTCETRSTDTRRVTECVPSCDNCPTECVDDVCTCEDCEVLSTGAELAGRCGDTSECKRGTCLVRVRDCVDEADGAVCAQAGLCARGCESDGDCPEDAGCSADGFCLPACDPANIDPESLRLGETCPGGTCTAVETADGASMMLCEPRGMAADSCVVDAHCASGTCTDGRCVSPESDADPDAGTDADAGADGGADAGADAGA